MPHKLRDQLYANVVASMTIADFINHFEALVKAGTHPHKAYDITSKEWSDIQGKPLYDTITQFERSRYHYYKLRGRRCKTLKQMAMDCGMTFKEFAMKVTLSRGSSRTHKEAYEVIEQAHVSKYGFRKFDNFKQYMNRLTKQNTQ